MIPLSTASSRILANAAAVATAMAGGTTTAEAQGLAAVLAALAARNDLAADPLKLSGTQQISTG